MTKGNFKPVKPKEGHYGCVYIPDICPYKERCGHNQEKCSTEAHKECPIFKELLRENNIERRIND